MPVAEFLLTVVGTVGYDALKAAIAKRFQGDPADLAERLANALDRAIREFFRLYGAKYPAANRSFLGRSENLAVIASSLHYSQPPLRASDLDPRGVDGGPDATPDEAARFVQLLTAEMERDRFLDKHIRERNHMREATEHHAETRAFHELIKQTLHAVQAQAGGSADDPWKDLVVNDPRRPPGWKPSQGQIYSTRFPDGTTIEFMLHGRLISVEYTFPDGGQWYFDSDVNGNSTNQRFPYPLSEYQIIVPPELLLQEQARDLPDGRRYILKSLKWGNTVEYYLDANGKLQDFRIARGAHIDHRNRRIVALAPHRE